jgi:hypothetical protein
MDAWDRLQFLIGSWASPVSGQPGEGISGSTTFSYHLDRKIIIRNSRAEFAPEPGKQQGLVHDDLLIIYQQPGEAHLRAIYFDNEGHIIHYTVSFPDRRPGVVFESEATAARPRARLVYEAAPDGTLGIEFSVAAPGGELMSHVKGTVTRNP